MSISRDIGYNMLLDKLLHFIAYTPRTIWEIKRHVDTIVGRSDITRERRDKIKEMLVGRVLELGLADDHKYATEYVKSKSTGGIGLGGRVYSRLEITRYLYRKGVPTQIIKDALTHYSDTGEEAQISKLAEKLHRTYGHERDSRTRAKIIRYLLAKGYNPEKVYPVVDTYFNMN